MARNTAWKRDCGKNLQFYVKYDIIILGSPMCALYKIKNGG